MAVACCDGICATLVRLCVRKRRGTAPTSQLTRWQFQGLFSGCFHFDVRI